MASHLVKSELRINHININHLINQIPLDEETQLLIAEAKDNYSLTE